jgi:hypothetical protein
MFLLREAGLSDYKQAYLTDIQEDISNRFISSLNTYDGFTPDGNPIDSDIFTSGGVDYNVARIGFG